MKLSRRELMKLGLGCAAVSMLPHRLFAAQQSALILRRIPSTGEMIPAIGIGTARRYDVGASADQRLVLKEVIRLFQQMGGKLVDTAPRYGTAESVVGDLVTELGIRDSLFIATKVMQEGGEAGLAEMEESCKRFRTKMIDLIAVHNLVDVQTQLATLREWKAAGRVRYLGITASSDGRYDDFLDVMSKEKLDFIQIDYALDNRNAADKILPLAADRGMAVMINLPFGRAGLFEATKNQKLPEWAAEFDCASWAQFFLKYILSHPAVTCAIPGTAKVEYLVDNLGAARGRLPDAALRRRMEDFIDKLPRVPSAKKGKKKK
ncbi:MAG: aldo/keto reductase [Desulfobacterales bacterium]|nr:aldo/keto reductase [Desulfobacterales bacterium]